MKKYFVDCYKYYILAFIIIIILGLLIFFCLFLNNDKSFKIESVNQTIYKDDYKIIINYPLINGNKTSEKIKKIVDSEKKAFLKEVKKASNNDNELNINYSYTNNSNLYSVHFRSYSYIDKEYKRLDKIYYFDKETNKEVNIDELITDDEFYEVLKDIAESYLIEHYSTLNIDKSIIEELELKKEHLNLLAFSKERLYIILPLYEINSSEIEVNIEVDYKYVRKYLNQGILKELNSISDEKFVSKTKRIRNQEEFEGKKLIALTFDDGPSYNKTRTLVTELNNRNARVTFFMLGELASKQKDLVRFVYDSGHTVASHTYDHKNLKKIDQELYSYEIDYTNEILESIIGEEIKYLRPPYGAYNDEVLDRTNISFILWSVDTLDWKLKNVDKITEAIVNNADDGEIILLHDIHQETIEAAIKAVDILQEQGYAFVSLDELIAYKDISVQPKKVYRYFK